jgi:hypothetical protein
LFLALLLLSLVTVRLRLSLVEVSILAGAGLLWIFNNAAPPYEGFPMRGFGFPRLYQSAFVPMVLYAARWSERIWHQPGAGAIRSVTLAALGLTLLGNAYVVYGPLLGAPDTTLAYHRFYRHATPEMQTENLARFPRRPIWLCTPDTTNLKPTWVN